MPPAFTKKPEERRFEVDSGASMHMASRKDLTGAELETVRTWKNQTTVVTANGDVLTKEEATVHVKELDLFVTVMVIGDTPAVLSLGKLCEEIGIVTIGPVVTNHISSKMTGKSIATQRTLYSSLSPVCRRVLPLRPHLLLLHLHLRIL